MDPTEVTLLVLAVPVGLLIGIACGVVGYSAWPMVVPLLFVIAGFDLYQAIFASVCVDLVNSIVMSVLYSKRGEVNVKEGLKIGGISVVGVVLGALVAFSVLYRFTSLFRGGVGYLNLLLGVLFVFRGWNMRKKSADLLPEPQVGSAGGSAGDGAVLVEKGDKIDGGNGSFLERWREKLTDKQRDAVTVVFCLLNAFFVGLIGFGGGFNVVLFLVILLGMKPLRAVGTAMVYAVIVLSVLCLSYLIFLGFVVAAWPFILAYSTCSAAGLLLGTHFAKRISEPALNVLIGAIVVVTGVAATVQALLMG
ncbi:MAG: TSUP family transporter [Promethearchaeota archaeon]